MSISKTELPAIPGIQLSTATHVQELDQSLAAAHNKKQVSARQLSFSNGESTTLAVKQISSTRLPLFDTLVYHGSREKKLVALTFDDGPDTESTPKIIAILNHYHLKGTFFLIGQKARLYPDVVKQIVTNGHAVGNHTWDHLPLTSLDPDTIKAEVVQTDDFIASITGWHTRLVRPPYGAANPGVVALINQMGYSVVDWSVDTRDWAGTPPDRIMQFVKNQVGPGGIILFHSLPRRQNTLTVLPEVIEYLQQQGYSCVTVPELLNAR